MEKYTQIIKNHPLFHGFTPEEIEKLLKSCHVQIRSFQKKSVFWDANQRVDEIGIVLEGNVHIERIDENGITSLIDVLLPGDSFGEMFSISRAPLNTTFRIIKDARILYFNCRRIVEAPISDPVEIRFLQNLSKVLSLKSYSFSKRLADTVHRTTRQRLQDYLSAQYHIKGKQKFTIPLDRQDLADYLFVDRSAMSKELSKMQDEGYFNYHKRDFEFLSKMPITEKEEEK